MDSRLRGNDDRKCGISFAQRGRLKHIPPNAHPFSDDLTKKTTTNYKEKYHVRPTHPRPELRQFLA